MKQTGSRGRFLHLAISFLVLLILSLLGVALPTASAQSASMVHNDCASTYTVQAGDTFYGIATRHFHITVEELWQLNRAHVPNPHYIYVGQVLCAPPSPADEPIITRVVVLQMTYHYTGPIGEVTLARGGFIAKRLIYPIEVIDVYTTSNEMEDALKSSREPLLIGARNPNDPDYTLFQIGSQPNLLPALGISNTLSIQTATDCQSRLTSIKNFVNEPALKDARLSLQLEITEGELKGVFLPLNVTFVSVPDNMTIFRTCRPDEQVVFALFPHGENTYRAVIFVTDNGWGPAGPSQRAACDAWLRAGFWGRFMRTLKKC